MFDLRSETRPKHSKTNRKKPSAAEAPEASGTREAGALGIKRQFVDIGCAEVIEGPPSSGREVQNSRRRQQQENRKKVREKRASELEDAQFLRQTRRRELYADQREASKIMWRHSEDGKPKGVTLCRWTMQSQHDRVSVVRETKVGEAPRAFLQGLQKCGLGWVCPVCTAEKAQEVRTKLNALLSRSRAEGWTVVMMTLTVRHDSSMTFQWLWERLSAASDQLRKTYAWKQLNKALIGSAKAVEATYGSAGWHPHYHVVLVFKDGLPGVEGSELLEGLEGDALRDASEALAIQAVEGLRDEWSRLINAQGLSGNEHAFQVQGAAHTGNYLSKWGISEELTLGHAKQGRGESLNPWELLRRSRVEGDFRAGELWHEFVSAIKGTHQIRLSPSLNKAIKEEIARLEADLAAKYESGELKEPKPASQATMIELGRGEWMSDGRKKRVRYLDAAEARTRREAEADVWFVRNSSVTDADMLALGDSENPRVTPESEDDNPELFMGKRRPSQLSLFSSARMKEGSRKIGHGPEPQDPPKGGDEARTGPHFS